MNRVCVPFHFLINVPFVCGFISRWRLNRGARRALRRARSSCVASFPGRQNRRFFLPRKKWPGNEASKIVPTDAAIIFMNNGIYIHRIPEHHHN